eukprot:CAMPEP_0176148898 /NCGR_PEP_ID=MMETSP0120_2-20121206/75949_1 /TAXON_ID=160619 /ORGANISM="Kryptoperidinium foliaceum, Strain CCMP 1326" /LENGTH=102 /DNA_ID=CAMNT_0017485631 /DNA_START=48 /DNA_END=352 /DNA_ORIENTATION=+
MEVAIVPGRGSNLPQDAVLSVRMGNVRRQAALDSGRPFRFPKPESKEDVVMKFELLAKVGAGFLVLKPDERRPKEYKVSFGAASDISCDVEVKPAEAKARSG